VRFALCDQDPEMRTGNAVKTRGLFINLSVRDLQSSVEFFRLLGFMYGASFYDLDGHHWEMVWLASRRRRVSGLSGLRMVLRWATIYFPFL
jgi:hypothetical protein